MGGPIFVCLWMIAAFADAAARSWRVRGCAPFVVMGTVAAMGVFDNAIDVVVPTGWPRPNRA